jgi:hypothetical protein
VNTIHSNLQNTCNALGPSRAEFRKGKRIMRKSRALVLAAATVAASIFGAAAIPANATPITLQSGNSSITLDPNNQDGMYNWTVDGTNQLNQQWFWYRSTSGVQHSVDTLSVISGPTEMDTNGDGKDDWANITYEDANKSFELSATFALNGGLAHSGMSDVAETLKVTNVGTSKLTYSLFDLTNFTLGGAGSQNATITGNNTATQTRGTNSAQTVISPKANEFAAGTYASLLNSLNTTSNLTLGNTGTVSDPTAAWAFEWDLQLNPGQSYVISLDKQIRTSVPEPTSAVALLGMGGLFLNRPRRRDEDPDPRTVAVAEA